MVIKTVPLGKDGPLVSQLGLGLMGMSEFYGPASDEESLKVMKAAIDKGCSFFDTADMYGSGKNEELLAQFLKENREKVFVCTKFGIVRGPDGSFNGISGKPEYVKEACNKSLERLGISQIDLYYQHRVDPTVPIEHTVQAMKELVEEGKVKYLGLSECSARALRRAYAIHPIHAIQVEYSPWATEIETNGLLETARELGVAIVAYSPLGRGFLTGQIKSPDDFPDDDFRKVHPRFVGENFAKNLEIVTAFEKIAAKKGEGIKAGQLALAWVMSKGDDFIPIPGTKRLKYLEENIAAADITLTEEEKAEIQGIVDSFNVEGGRYDAGFMTLCYADGPELPVE